MAERYVSSKHCVECQARRTTEYNRTARGVVSAKFRNIKKTYGLTEPEFYAMWDSQGRTCAICLDALEHHEICVDHCHQTHVVRALLCNRCNRAVGLLRDNPSACLRAARLLEKHNAPHS